MVQYKQESLILDIAADKTINIDKKQDFVAEKAIDTNKRRDTIAETSILIKN